VCQDEEMLNMFRPSLEEADIIKERYIALDFIGKRGSAEGAGRVRERAVSSSSSNLTEDDPATLHGIKLRRVCKRTCIPWRGTRRLIASNPL
jgi:hypothetical protein